MGGRSVFNRCMRIASALALLVAVTISPLKPLRSSGYTSRSELARSDFASGPARVAFPIRVVPNSVTSRTVTVKALHTQNEEEESAGDIRPANHFFTIPPSLLDVASRDLTMRGDARLLFPLRC